MGMHLVWTNLLNRLTVLPYFLDGFLPLPTICGPSGIHKRWDFKVNFVVVILWTNSPKFSYKLRFRHNWRLSESKITSWIINWKYKLRHISSTFNNFFHIPFHQSTFHPHQSQPPAPVPDPTRPVAPQSAPPASSTSFNAEEMIQQMKNTVESSMQAFVDKTQERNMNQQPPAPAQPPVQTAPPIPSYPSPPCEVPPPPQHPQRRSRSRSHRHHGAPDKPPVFVPRSPRRATPLRRLYRLSRPRSAHSRRQSTSRNPSRRPSRASSVQLRSASPRRREVRQDHDDDFYHGVPNREPASLHPASWEYQHYPQDPWTHNEYYQNEYSSYKQPSTNKWKSWNQWKDISQSKPRTHASGWIDYPKNSYKHQRYHDSSTKSSNRPLTAFSSDRPRKKSTQIQLLNPITCIHQCRPSWTCSHQSPRWFQRRMGSSCCACSESSR